MMPSSPREPRVSLYACVYVFMHVSCFAVLSYKQAKCAKCKHNKKPKFGPPPAFQAVCKPFQLVATAIWEPPSSFEVGSLLSPFPMCLLFFSCVARFSSVFFEIQKIPKIGSNTETMNCGALPVPGRLEAFQIRFQLFGSLLAPNGTLP